MTTTLPCLSTSLRLSAMPLDWIGPMALLSARPARRSLPAFGCSPTRLRSSKQRTLLGVTLTLLLLPASTTGPGEMPTFTDWGAHGTNRYLLLLLCCCLQIPPHLWAPDSHSSGHTGSVWLISSLHGGVHAVHICRGTPRYGHLASGDTWYCGSSSAINGFSQLGPLSSYISMNNNKNFNNAVSPSDAKVRTRTNLLGYKAN